MFRQARSIPRRCIRSARSTPDTRTLDVCTPPLSPGVSTPHHSPGVATCTPREKKSIAMPPPPPVVHLAHEEDAYIVYLRDRPVFSVIGGLSCTLSKCDGRAVLHHVAPNLFELYTLCETPGYPLYYLHEPLHTAHATLSECGTKVAIADGDGTHEYTLSLDAGQKTLVGAGVRTVGV